MDGQREVVGDLVGNQVVMVLVRMDGLKVDGNQEEEADLHGHHLLEDMDQDLLRGGPKEVVGMVGNPVAVVAAGPKVVGN